VVEASHETDLLHDGSLPASMSELIGWRERVHSGSRVVTEDGTVVPAQDWARRVPRIAGGLAAMGVEAGDHVALWARNSVAWLELWFAVSWLDAVLVPLNTRLSGPEVADVLDRGDARWLFWEPVGALAEEGSVTRALPAGCRAVGIDDGVDDPWRDAALADPVESRETPGGVGMVQFTSGSTGSPKGVMLRPSAMIRNAFGLAHAWQVTGSDVVLCANPLFHNGGAVFSHLVAVAGGADLVLMRRWDPDRAIDLIHRHGVSVFPTIDTMLRDLLLRRERWSELQSLRVASTAGSRVLFEGVRDAWDCRPSNVFGMTETSPNVCVGDVRDDDETRLEWIGRPQPGLEVELRDESGDVVPAGTVGEIHVRGWAVTPGYYRDPVATAATIGPDGFLRTGDLGLLSPDGRLAYSGRLKRMAKSGGENVSLLEVEEAIREHPGVDDVAAVCVPHERYGEAIVAFVTGAAVAEDEPGVIEFLRSRLAHYKVPRRVVTLEAFPRTGSQKVDYVALAAHARQHGSVTSHHESATADA
jgi:acyl-CoA synthetase (AMP-forming)/AMP-acid ligase II